MFPETDGASPAPVLRRVHVGGVEAFDAPCGPEPQVVCDWSLQAIDAAVDDMAVGIQLCDPIDGSKIRSLLELGVLLGDPLLGIECWSR